MSTTPSAVKAAPMHETMTLSPAPRSTALAVTAITLSLLTILLIAVLGGAATSASNDASSIPIILSTVGVISGVAILWVAIRAIATSKRARRLEQESDVLGARTEAASSREKSFLVFALLFVLWILSGLVLIAGLNDGSIQKTFLRWDLIAESFVDVFKAFGLNIFIAVVAQIFVLALGLVLAVARIAPGRAGRPIRAIAIAYIDIMRAVPAIIVIYLVGFGLPLTGLPIVADLPPVWFAIIALTITYSAYVAEIYRGGIEAVHSSQQSAARSLGLSYGMTLRKVILPQAIRYGIPPLLSIFIALQKDTSLVNIIGTMDAFNQAKFYASASFNLSSVTVVAALFILITIPQTRLADVLLAKTARKRGRV